LRSGGLLLARNLATPTYPAYPPSLQLLDVRMHLFAESQCPLGWHQPRPNIPHIIPVLSPLGEQVTLPEPAVFVEATASHLSQGWVQGNIFVIEQRLLSGILPPTCGWNSRDRTLSTSSRRARVIHDIYDPSRGPVPMAKPAGGLL